MFASLKYFNPQTYNFKKIYVSKQTLDSQKTLFKKRNFIGFYIVFIFSQMKILLKTVQNYEY